MSSLLKIFTGPENQVFKLRNILYERNISSIFKEENGHLAPINRNESFVPTFGLFIDSDQEEEAKLILRSFNKQLA